ncbi:hypothetical protein T439DRAFT_322407 [Meredithblackwellia eburnea MCA 4105]
MQTSPEDESPTSLPYRPAPRCAECTTRRVKCNREIPCAPCIKRGRGNQCHIASDVGLVRGPAGPRSYSSASKAIGSSPRTKPLAESSISKGVQTPSEWNRPYTSTETSRPMEVADGEARLFETDLATLGLPGQREMVYDDSGSPSSSVANTINRLLGLVPYSHSTSLVEISIKLLSVLHSAVHGPTFLEEHATWLMAAGDGRPQTDPSYLALYFAVISVGTHFMEPEIGLGIGLSISEMASFPAIWFNCSLEALDASQYMANHRLETLQTVCILTLAAHAFGPSSRIFTLQACASHIAQSLKLHLLTAETGAEPGVIKREIGRRVWMFLINQQRLSPTAQQPGALFLDRGRASLPANCDDEDLVEGSPVISKPLFIGTIMTNNLGKARVADIMKEFFTSFYNSSTLAQQQAAVAEADRRLLTIFDDFPTLRPTATVPYPTSFDMIGSSWVVKSIHWTWEQHLWAIIIPHRRLLVHRAFLSRSFRDPQYEPSRQICLNAARAILKERQRPIPACFDKQWHVSADIVTAGVLLGVIARHASSAEERSSIQQDVRDCIEVLSRKTVQHRIVDRGLVLLRQVLADSDLNPFEPEEKLPVRVEPSQMSPGTLNSAYNALQPGGIQLFGPVFQGEEEWETSYAWAFPGSDLFSGDETWDTPYDPHAPELIPGPSLGPYRTD